MRVNLGPTPYGLHLTDHWPLSQNSKNDIVSSAGPGRFAFSCLELALAGYTTLGISDIETFGYIRITQRA